MASVTYSGNGGQFTDGSGSKTTAYAGDSTSKTIPYQYPTSSINSSSGPGGATYQSGSTWNTAANGSGTVFSGEVDKYYSVQTEPAASGSGDTGVMNTFPLGGYFNVTDIKAAHPDFVWVDALGNSVKATDSTFCYKSIQARYGDWSYSETIDGGTTAKANASHSAVSAGHAYANQVDFSFKLTWLRTGDWYYADSTNCGAYWRWMETSDLNKNILEFKITDLDTGTFSGTQYYKWTTSDTDGAFLESSPWTGVQPQSNWSTWAAHQPSKSATGDDASYVYKGTYQKAGVTTSTNVKGSFYVTPGINYKVEVIFHPELCDYPITNSSVTVATFTFKSGSKYTRPNTDTYYAVWEKPDMTFTPPVIADNLTYDSAAHNVIKTAGTAVGGTIYYSADGGTTWSTTIPTQWKAGGYNIQWKAVPDADHKGGKDATSLGTFTINKKALTFLSATDTKTYDGTALVKKSFATEPALGGSDTKTVTWTGTQTYVGTSDNTYSMVIKRGTEDVTTSCYTLTLNKGKLTVNKRAVTITANSAEKTYDGTPLTKTGGTASGLATGDTLSSVTTTGSQTDAGTSNNVPSNAVIKKGTADVTSNYTITYKNGTLKVNKAAGWVTTNPTTITVTNSSKNNKNVGKTTENTYHKSTTGGNATTVSSPDTDVTVSRSGDVITVTAKPACAAKTVTITVTNPESTNWLEAKTTFTVKIEDVWKTVTYYHGTSKLAEEDIDTSDSYTMKKASTMSIPALGDGWKFYGWTHSKDSKQGSKDKIFDDNQTFDYNATYGNVDMSFYTIHRKKINLYYDVYMAGSKSIYYYYNPKDTTNPTSKVDFNVATTIYPGVGWQQYYWKYNSGSYAGTDIITTGKPRDIVYNANVAIEYDFDNTVEELDFYMLYKRDAKLEYDCIGDLTPADPTPATLPAQTFTMYYNTQNTASRSTAVEFPVNITELTRTDWLFKRWHDADYAKDKYLRGSTFIKTPRLSSSVDYLLVAEWEEQLAFIWLKKGGVWYRGPAWIKTKGAWIKGTQASIKIGGVWKKGVLS